MMMFGSCSGSNQSLARFLLTFPGVVHLLLQLPVLVLLPLHLSHNVVHLGLLGVDFFLQPRLLRFLTFAFRLNMFLRVLHLFDFSPLCLLCASASSLLRQRLSVDAPFSCCLKSFHAIPVGSGFFLQWQLALLSFKNPPCHMMGFDMKLFHKRQ